MKYADILLDAGIQIGYVLAKFTKLYNCKISTYGTSEAALNAALSYIDTNGVYLYEVSKSLVALVNVLTDFNTFMAEIQTGENAFAEEFKIWDKDSGKRVMPKLEITVPGGAKLVLIDFNSVLDFRFDLSYFQFKGLPLPFFNGWVAVYWQLTPNFQYSIPFTEQLNFTDPLDQTVKKGVDCTPVQSLSDTDAEYLMGLFFWSHLLTRLFFALGLHNSIKAWFQRFWLKKNFNKIIDTNAVIQQMMIDQNMTIRDIDAFNDDYYKGSNSKILKILRRLGSHPYG